MTDTKTFRASCKNRNICLLEIRHLRSLPDFAQRFFKTRQILQDFHQPLHGLIRRLKKFLQSLEVGEAIITKLNGKGICVSQ